STRQPATFKVSETIGVPVFELTNPSQRGARRSSTKISASRDGTIRVGFSDVVIAMIAPRVTIIAAPQGKYTAATSVMGALLAPSLALGKTPNATADIAIKISEVAVTPIKNTSGSRRVLSFVSPAV